MIENLLKKNQQFVIELEMRNQHFRDHMCVHHQGSDVLNETVNPSQALVYSNNLVNESAKEHSTDISKFVHKTRTFHIVIWP